MMSSKHDDEDDGFGISMWDFGEPEAWDNVDAFVDGESIDDDDDDLEDYIAAAAAATTEDDADNGDGDDGDDRDDISVERELAVVVSVVPSVNVFDLDTFRNALILSPTFQPDSMA